MGGAKWRVRVGEELCLPDGLRRCRDVDGTCEITAVLLRACFFLLVRCVCWWHHDAFFFFLFMADGMAFLRVLLFEDRGGAVALA